MTQQLYPGLNLGVRQNAVAVGVERVKLSLGFGRLTRLHLGLQLGQGKHPGPGRRSSLISAASPCRPARCC